MDEGCIFSEEKDAEELPPLGNVPTAARPGPNFKRLGSFFKKDQTFYGYGFVVLTNGLTL